MAKKQVPFHGTAAQAEALKKEIEAIKGMPGALIPCLHKAQEIYGYLPKEVQSMVAEGLSVPLAEVYGVVTFYSQFSLFPKGKYQISICLGTACYIKGAGNVLEKVKEFLGIDVGECTPDGLFSIEATRCIGACGLAPVMTINDDVYGQVTVDMVADILKKYQGGQA